MIKRVIYPEGTIHLMWIQHLGGITHRLGQLILTAEDNQDRAWIKESLEWYLNWGQDTRHQTPKNLSWYTARADSTFWADSVARQEANLALFDAFCDDVTTALYMIRGEELAS